MLATTPKSNIAVVQPRFEISQIQLIKDTVAKGCTDQEFDLYMAVCNRTGLDPFAKQIYPVPRWDSSLGRNAMSIQVSIDGFRLIATRTGKYAGQVGPYWCGKDGKWLDVWLSDTPPAAAKIGVLHSDFREPLYRVAKYSSFVQTKKNGEPNQFWARMPELMIAKVAESQALRAAFPQELSGLYTPDEMGGTEVQSESMQYATANPDEQERLDLKQKSLTLIRQKRLTKVDIVSLLADRYNGKSTSDELSLDELRDFAEFLDKCSSKESVVDVPSE